MAESVSAWRPIETAPKDGTDFVGYYGPAFDPVYGIVSWSKGKWSTWWDESLTPQPWSHWMPLPEHRP